MAIVGIDFGSRRVGIAVSESGILASAHSVLRNDRGLDDLVSRIAAIGEQLSAQRYVVGVPRSKRADAARTEQKFARFAELLRQKTCTEVVLWDEALTSVEAEADLRARGKRGRELRSAIDMEAARVILQSYLDEMSRGTP